MSDEEKKAIESVKDMFEDVTIKDIDEQSITIYGVAMLDVIKVLTIVEKQSKEIEHWKTGMKIVEKDKNNHIERLEKEIEELKEKNKFLNWYFENQKENFIHKDKIKAKIEEYEKELNKLLQKEEWLEPHDTIKRNKYMHYIEFGQSLLEKE